MPVDKDNKPLSSQSKPKIATKPIVVAMDDEEEEDEHQEHQENQGANLSEHDQDVKSESEHQQEEEGQEEREEDDKKDIDNISHGLKPYRVVRGSFSVVLEDGRRKFIGNGDKVMLTSNEAARHRNQIVPWD